MAITANANKLQIAASKLQRGLDRLSHLDDNTILSFLDIAIFPERQFIVSSILQNYNASGLGDTGKLKRALRRINIRNKFRGKQLFLNITMPDGVSDYKEGKATSSFYKVASSLQSGSVRFIGSRAGRFKNQGFASKTKKKIKKTILGKGKKNTIIAGQKIDLTSRKTENLTTTVKSSGGAFVVTKPKPYFLLRPEQWSKLYDNLSNNLDKILSDNWKTFLD